MEESYKDMYTRICSRCGANDPQSQMHHTISRAVINRMEKTGLWHLLHGMENLSKEMSIEVMRKKAIDDPRGVIELCRPCHQMTDSFLYRKWMLENEEIEKFIQAEFRNISAQSMRFRPYKNIRRNDNGWGVNMENRCNKILTRKSGERQCMNHKTHGDYCSTHRRHNN